MQDLEMRLPRSEVAGRSWVRRPGRIQPAYSLAELYHENAKYHRDLMVTEPLNAQAAMAVPRRSAQDGLALPKPSPTLAFPIGDALRARRSIRQFRFGAMAQQTLADLLYYTAGATGSEAVEFAGQTYQQVTRPYPSAGALYPIDLFVLIRNVDGMASGAYYYGAAEHALSPLPIPVTTTQTLLATTPMHPEVVNLFNSQVILVQVAAFQRQSAKYRRRAYRFTLQESGHIAQNALLAATALGLGGVTLGAFYDDEVHRLLGLDGVSEAILYLIPIGVPDQLEPW
jgi:SagB-type dehydrogenase family enzyme